MHTSKKLLLEWDKGTESIRGEILSRFVQHNKGKTCHELEEELHGAASLFLNRLTAWLRLSYMMGKCTNLQLKAIHIFLSATNGYVLYSY